LDFFQQGIPSFGIWIKRGIPWEFLEPVSQDFHPVNFFGVGLGRAGFSQFRGKGFFNGSRLVFPKAGETLLDGQGLVHRNFLPMGVRQKVPWGLLTGLKAFSFFPGSLGKGCSGKFWAGKFLPLEFFFRGKAKAL